MLKKRSITLSGHPTSVALEPEFWAALEALARAERVSLAALIVRIDETRAGRPLASACRIAALKWAQGSEEQQDLATNDANKASRTRSWGS